MLVRPLLDDHGKVVLSPMTVPQEFVNWCDGRLFFYKVTQTDDESTDAPEPTEVYLPAGWAKLVETRGEYPGVYRVVGTSRTPVIRQDGSIVETDGYDPQTKLLLDLDDELKELGVPEEPSADDVNNAVAVICDVFGGFPFKSKADCANAIGLSMTSFVRMLFPSMIVPIHAVRAHQQSSGKSLVGMDIPGTFAGSDMALVYTEDEAEIRKLVTSALTDGADKVLCFDNVAPGMRFESAVLAQGVMDTEWKDRLLGKNKVARVAMDRVITVTGNNLEIGADISVRTVLIELDPLEVNPAAREFSVRLDNPSVLREMRPDRTSEDHGHTRA